MFEVVIYHYVQKWGADSYRFHVMQPDGQIFFAITTLYESNEDSRDITITVSVRTPCSEAHIMLVLCMGPNRRWRVSKGTGPRK
jgi:hypothetical protein